MTRVFAWLLVTFWLIVAGGRTPPILADTNELRPNVSTVFDGSPNWVEP